MHPNRVSRAVPGFSLIELIIVLALIAMMSLVATPWFIKLYQRNQVRSAAHEIQTTLLAARMKAARRNQQVSVVISSVVPPIELLTIEPPPLTPGPTPIPSVLKLPAGSVEFVTTPSSAGGIVTFGGDGRLVNFPTTPAAYQIQGPVGKIMPTPVAVRINAAGRVEVVLPKEWP
jgi:prepilin-type N-terminal cleavage/methylation domain-containing protein